MRIRSRLQQGRDLLLIDSWILTKQLRENRVAPLFVNLYSTTDLGKCWMTACCRLRRASARSTCGKRRWPWSQLNTGNIPAWRACTDLCRADFVFPLWATGWAECEEERNLLSNLCLVRTRSSANPITNPALISSAQHTRSTARPPTHPEPGALFQPPSRPPTRVAATLVLDRTQNELSQLYRPHSTLQLLSRHRVYSGPASRRRVREKRLLELFDHRLLFVFVHRGHGGRCTRRGVRNPRGAGTFVLVLVETERTRSVEEEVLETSLVEAIKDWRQEIVRWSHGNRQRDGDEEELGAFEHGGSGNDDDA